MTAKGFALLGALVAVVGTVNAYPTQDLVKQLWQWDDISFGLYSGYVQIPRTQKQLHYVTALSQRTPSTDPVVIWFNGGPGCSSMLAFMQENGPLAIDDGEDYIKTNPYPWHARANMLWLESPAGVGWSVG